MSGPAGDDAAAFKDHFSAVAGDYSRYRPQYPPELFDYLAGLAPARDLAWDCATGSGQAALGLAPRFRRVLATDASPQQIAAATPAPNLKYLTRPAEASGFAAGCLDLISIAQALHWFDLAAFYVEAQRVLKPGGVLGAWCYGRVRVEPDIDALIEAFYQDLLGPYWPPERVWVERAYEGLPFPFPELPPPAFTMTQTWTLPDCLGYLATWSAVKAYRVARGTNPMDWVVPRLAQVWGPPERPIQARWPLALRVGRRP